MRKAHVSRVLLCLSCLVLLVSCSEGAQQPSQQQPSAQPAQRQEQPAQPAPQQEPPAKTEPETPPQVLPDQKPSNVAALSSGAKLVVFSSQSSSTWQAANIIDGKPNIGWSAASSTTFPHTFVVELPGEFLVSRVSFDNGTQEGAYPGISAKDVRISVSLEAEDLGYTDAGTFTLKKGEIAQGFKLATPARARWIKLTILSNHGHKNYTELMEFRAIGVPVE